MNCVENFVCSYKNINFIIEQQVAGERASIINNSMAQPNNTAAATTEAMETTSTEGNVAATPADPAVADGVVLTQVKQLKSELERLRAENKKHQEKELQKEKELKEAEQKRVKELIEDALKTIVPLFKEMDTKLDAADPQKKNMSALIQSCQQALAKDDYGQMAQLAPAVGLVHNAGSMYKSAASDNIHLVEELRKAKKENDAFKTQIGALAEETSKSGISSRVSGTEPMEMNIEYSGGAMKRSRGRDMEDATSDIAMKAGRSASYQSVADPVMGGGLHVQPRVSTGRVLSSVPSASLATKPTNFPIQFRNMYTPAPDDSKSESLKTKNPELYSSLLASDRAADSKGIPVFAPTWALDRTFHARDEYIPSGEFSHSSAAVPTVGKINAGGRLAL